MKNKSLIASARWTQERAGRKVRMRQTKGYGEKKPMCKKLEQSLCFHQ